MTHNNIKDNPFYRDELLQYSVTFYLTGDTELPHRERKVWADNPDVIEAFETDLIAQEHGVAPEDVHILAITEEEEQTNCPLF
jgi:hypothetical protein